MGCFKQALPMCQQGLQLHQEILGDKHPDTSASLGNLATCLCNMGLYEEALPMSQRALAIGVPLLGLNNPQNKLQIHSLATILRHMGQYAAAVSDYELVQKATDNPQRLEATVQELWRDVAGPVSTLRRA
jgi:tetratricopeptide (TPR) repeat protein